MVTRATAAFDIAWVAELPTSAIGRAMEAEVPVYLPHFLDSPDRRTPSGGLNAEATPASLALGILMTGDDGPPSLLTSEDRARPTRTQLRAALSVVAPSLGADDEGQMCLKLAATLRERHGRSASLAALRRSIELIPDCYECRTDLIPDLFFAALADPQSARSLLAEVAREFEYWLSGPTSGFKNQEVVFYCGLASLSYLGFSLQRELVIRKHTDIWARSNWLLQQLSRIRTAKPSSLEEIAPTTDSAIAEPSEADTSYSIVRSADGHMKVVRTEDIRPADPLPVKIRPPVARDMTDMALAAGELAAEMFHLNHNCHGIYDYYHGRSFIEAFAIRIGLLPRRDYTKYAFELALAQAAAKEWVDEATTRIELLKGMTSDTPDRNRLIAEFFEVAYDGTMLVVFCDWVFAKHAGDERAATACTAKWRELAKEAKKVSREVAAYRCHSTSKQGR